MKLSKFLVYIYFNFAEIRKDYISHPENQNRYSLPFDVTYSYEIMGQLHKN